MLIIYFNQLLVKKNISWKTSFHVTIMIQFLNSFSKNTRIYIRVKTRLFFVGPLTNFLLGYIDKDVGDRFYNLVTFNVVSNLSPTSRNWHQHFLSSVSLLYYYFIRCSNVTKSNGWTPTTISSWQSDKWIRLAN